MKKIFYILLITQLTAGICYSQSGWVRQDLNTNYELCGVHFINESTGFVGGGWADTSLIFRTTNAGQNWQLIYNEAERGIMTFYFFDNNTGFAIGYWGLMLKTTNTGLNWTLSSQGSNTLFSIVFPCRDTGYICGKWSTILKTTNGGGNWFNQTSSGVMNMNICFVNNNTGYIASEDDYVLKTTNGGNNWIRKYLNHEAILYGVYFMNANTGFCVGYDYSSKFYIAKTTNGAEEWTKVFNQSQGILYRIVFVSNQTGYAVGSGFLKTTNAGQNWFIQQNSDVKELYSVYFVNALTGYACGIAFTNGHGVLYKTTTGGEPIGIKAISGEVPTHFVLHQNYPNPFNPGTTIKFSIPSSKGVTTLTIYDILGREVAVLVNEKLSPGIYEVEWSATGGASNFASGIYFYQLSTSEFIRTRRMVLLK